jgi:hypothetical protein
MTNALRVNNFSFSYKKSIESIHNVQELISNTIWQVQITVPCNMFSLAFGDFDKKKGAQLCQLQGNILNMTLAEPNMPPHMVAFYITA